MRLDTIHLKGVAYYFLPRTFSKSENILSAERPVEQTGMVAPLSINKETPTEFAHDFESAFRKLDQQSGGRRMLTLAALRQALPQYERTAFDAGVYALQKANRYQLSPFYGGEAKLSPSEHENGIHERDTLFTHIRGL